MGTLTEVYLAFGSNLGNRLAAIRTGVSVLAERGVELVAFSSLYFSRPKYITEQPPFLNCVGRFLTSLVPEELLSVCQEAELAVGRQSREKYGPRELDVDILLFGEEIISAKGLSIPHPHLAERLFVLVPLAELAPDLVIPGLSAISDLLARAIHSLPEEEGVVSLGAFYESERNPGKGDGIH